MLAHYDFTVFENTAELNGYSIRYWDSGTNKPVVLLCGGVGSSVEIWAHQFATLSAMFRLIAWDYPGHGLSAGITGKESLQTLVDIGRELINHCTSGAFHIVGNSMGAAIAIRLCDKLPEQVLSIGLLNGATLGKDTPTAFKLMSVPLLGRLLARPGHQAFDNQCKAIFFDTSAVDPFILNAIGRNSSRHAVQQGLRHFVRLITTFAGQRSELIEQTTNILLEHQPPTWIVHGEQDAVIPLAHSKALQKVAPFATLQCLLNCGHTPQVEQPAIINQLIQAVVQKER